MTRQQYQQLKVLFERGQTIAPGERSRWLAGECGEDGELLAAARQLFNGDVATSPLESPVMPARALEGLLSASRSADPLAGDRLESQDGSSGEMPIRVGRFEVVRRIGEGGMGVVYEAIQDTPRRRVALKLIRAGWMSSEMRRRFQAEAQLLGQLQHPGIAAVYEAGEADVVTSSGVTPAQPFLAMELVQGTPLTTYAQAAQLDLHSRLRLMASICDAVHHAHQRLVLHRDLKPGNILVTEGTEAPRREGKKDDARSRFASPELRASVPSCLPASPKIIDFGVARLCEDEANATTRTRTGQLVGTLQYMSPEQIAGDTRQLDVRSDVYALGVILYELVSGRLPYDVRDVSLGTALRTIGEHEPPTLRVEDAALASDLGTIAAKALEKDRERRYPSAADLAADIRRTLADEPILARPQTTFYRFRKFARRNRALVGGATATLAALVIGLFATLFFAIAEAEQRKLANGERDRARRERDVAQVEAYRANLAAAQAALQHWDSAAARVALDAADESLRGWEWRHLSLAADRSLRSMRIEQPPLLAMGASRDEHAVFTVDSSQRLQIWSVAGLQLLHTVSLEDAVSPGAADSPRVQVFPSPCGRRVAVHRIGIDTQVFDATSGERVWVQRIAAEAAGSIWRSDSAEIVLLASQPQQLVFLDGETGSVRREVAVSFSGFTQSRGYSLDGRAVAFDSFMHALAIRFRVLDLASGRLTEEPLLGTEPTEWADGPARRLRVAGPRLVRSDPELRDMAVFDVGSNEVIAAEVSSDRRRLAYALLSGDVVVFDYRSGMRLGYVQHGGSPMVAFAGSGGTFVTASADGLVKVWDERALETPTTIHAVGRNALSTLERDGANAVVTGWGGVARMELLAGRPLWARNLTRSYYDAVSVSPDQRYFALLAGSRVVFASLIDGLPTHTLTDLGGGARLLNWRSDGGGLWVADGERARCVEPRDGSIVAEVRVGAKEVLLCSHAGDAVFENAGRVAIRRADTFEAVREVDLPADDGAAGSVHRAAIGSDRHLVLLRGRHAIVTSTASDSQAVLLAEAGAGGASVTFAGEDRLAIAKLDGTVDLWSIARRERLLTLRAPRGEMRDIVFDAESETLTVSTSTGFTRFEVSREGVDFAARAQVAAAKAAIARVSQQRTIAVDDVVAALEQDASLADDVRAEAIRTTRLVGNDLGGLNERAWAIALQTTATPAEYAEAMRLVSIVCAEMPNEWGFLNTRALCEYRTGDFTAMHATLLRCYELRQMRAGRLHACDVTLQAMLELATGNGARAGEALREARRLFEAFDSEDADTRRLLLEAEALAGRGE